MRRASPPTLAVALLLAACGKPAATQPLDAGAAATGSATAGAVTSSAAAASPAQEEPGIVPRPGPLAATSEGVAGLPAPPAEPRRASLSRLEDERALAPHKALVLSHFGGGLPSPLELQAASLPDEHRAFLLYGEPRRRAPFLLVTSAEGEFLWTKERPLAGTRQVVTEMVIMPGPQGEVALAWCDIPTQIVGLRKWSATGVVLADFEVIEVDVCEALSALYWPGRGFVAVASQHGAARAQRLDELGKRAWGPKGTELPWTARPSSPASIAVDSDTSVIVLQVGDLRRGDAVATDRVLAMRFDTLGTAIWERPLDLGAAPAGAVAPKVSAVGTEPGKVRVSLGPRLSVTVTSAGSILGAR